MIRYANLIEKQGLSRFELKLNYLSKLLETTFYALILDKTNIKLVLGPVCFTMYMNDIDKGIQSELSKFADDTEIICPIRDERDKQQLQQDLDVLMSWTKKWQMKFNVGKCSVMHFGHGNPKYKYQMDGKELIESDEEKDLGVYVNTSMKFSRQCAEQQRKPTELWVLSNGTSSILTVKLY